MLDFQPLSLGLKTLADSYTFKYGEGSCQHSFVSSWCLRQKYGDLFCEHDSFLYTLRSKKCTPDKRVYLFPHGSRENTEALKRAVQNVIDDAHENNAKVSFETVTQSAKESIMNLFPGKFEAVCNRDLSEYIYTSKSLLTLSGRHLKNKRNSFNAFCRDYDGRFSVTKILPEHIGMIRELQGEWLDEKLVRENNPIHESQLKQENDGVQCALDDFFELGLSGIVIFIDGELKGYMYGSPLSADCFDTISGKGSSDVPNISTVLKREIVRLCCESFKFVNFEEDLGIDGLRTMKTEYMPIRMIEKFVVKEL